MSPSRSDRHSFPRAFVLSIGLHLCAAALVVVSNALPVGSGTVQSGGHAFETTRISYLTIAHRIRRPARTGHAAARRTAPPEPHAKLVRRQSAVPVADAKPSTLDAVPAAASASRHAFKRLSVPLALPEAQHERPSPPASPAPLVASRATSSAPSPAALPSPAVAAPASPAAATAGVTRQVAARGLDVPPGGWGQSFEHPLVADESAIETLRARYHASAQILVEVDESGRATHVSMPADLPDDLRAELERRLLELRYVPAECNGLRCTGTLQIVL